MCDGECESIFPFTNLPIATSVLRILQQSFSTSTALDNLEKVWMLFAFVAWVCFNNVVTWQQLTVSKQNVTSTRCRHPAVMTL